MFDLEAWLSAESWDAGRVDVVGQPQQWSFTDADYKREHKACTAALAAFHVSNKLRPLAHCHVLAKLWRVPVHEVILDIVLCHNLWGRQFTAHRYRFSKNHNFSWLPKTGKKVSTDIVWHPKLKTFVRWKEGYPIPRQWCLQRELRNYPTEYANTKLAVTTRTPPGRKPRQRTLLHTSFTEGLQLLDHQLSELDVNKDKNNR